VEGDRREIDKNKRGGGPEKGGVSGRFGSENGTKKTRRPSPIQKDPLPLPFFSVFLAGPPNLAERKTKQPLGAHVKGAGGEKRDGWSRGVPHALKKKGGGWSGEFVIFLTTLHNIACEGRLNILDIGWEGGCR